MRLCVGSLQEGRTFCAQVVLEAVLLHRSTSDFFYLLSLSCESDVSMGCALFSRDALSPSASFIQFLLVLASFLNAECRYSALCSYMYLFDVSKDRKRLSIKQHDHHRSGNL